MSQRTVTRQYRYRTLGDGTKMLLPAPGVQEDAKPLFCGRETTVLKQARNMIAQHAYGEFTAAMQPAARFNPKLSTSFDTSPRAKHPPSSCWYLPAGRDSPGP